MPTGTRVDPFRNFNFRLEIDGLSVGSFRECSGLAADGNAVDYRAGTDIPRSVRKLIGLQTYSNITLKRGYTQNHELWDWYKNIVNGIPDRRHGAVMRMDATSTAITPIRTDVAGFVGIAASGPLDTPAPVQSWKDFQAYFGGFIG